MRSKRERENIEWLLYLIPKWDLLCFLYSSGDAEEPPHGTALTAEVE
jgi:hypothetical protein